MPAILAALFVRDDKPQVSPLRFASVEITSICGAPGKTQIPFGDDRKKGKDEQQIPTLRYGMTNLEARVSVVALGLAVTHLSRGETAAKMGHPGLVGLRRLWRFGRNTEVFPFDELRVRVTDQRRGFPSGMTSKGRS